MEGILLDTEGNVDGHIEYSPKEDPLNPDSAPVEVLLSRFTGTLCINFIISLTIFP